MLITPEQLHQIHLGWMDVCANVGKTRPEGASKYIPAHIVEVLMAEEPLRYKRFLGVLRQVGGTLQEVLRGCVGFMVDGLRLVGDGQGGFYVEKVEAGEMTSCPTTGSVGLTCGGQTYYLLSAEDRQEIRCALLARSEALRGLVGTPHLSDSTLCALADGAQRLARLF